MDLSQGWVSERRSDRSSYSQECRDTKIRIEMEDYWWKKMLKGEHNVAWVRMRCGNMGRKGKRACRDDKCLVCEIEVENPDKQGNTKNTSCKY